MTTYHHIFSAAVGMVLTILIGMFGFAYFEDITLFDALWLTMITVLTVGYGDSYPVTLQGKIFALIIIPVSIGIVTYGLGAVAAALLEGKISKSVGRKKMEKKISNLKGHIIICGLGRVGEQVVSQIEQEGFPFVIVEREEQVVEQHHRRLSIVGDATEDAVLIKAGIDRAAGLVATLPNDADNVFISLTAKGLNPHIQVVARAGKLESEEKLRRAGADKVINPSSIGGRRMAMTILKPISVDYVDTILHSDKQDFGVMEITIQENSNLANQSLREANIRHKYGVTVVAIQKPGQIINNPAGDERLMPHDIVIVFGSNKDFSRFEQATKG